MTPFPYAVRLAGCRTRASARDGAGSGQAGEHGSEHGSEHRCEHRCEQGQIGLLILGLFSLVLVLILGAVDVTAAQLARMRLLDAADAAALDAADALDERAAYETGVLDALALTDDSVAEAAANHLARVPRPPGITAWSVVPQTGTTDGATAVVTVQGDATLPMSGWILQSLGGSVTITVTSRARAPLG